jgi:DNA-binding transcriptional LysR family regulator
LGVLGGAAGGRRGYTAARMGIAMLLCMVLNSFPQANFLSIHALPMDLNHASTMLVWRKGARSPKIGALISVLMEDAGRKPTKRAVKDS